jgi:hypothetical protein
MIYSNCRRLASNIEETEVTVVETRWRGGVGAREGLNVGRQGEKKM